MSKDSCSFQVGEDRVVAFSSAAFKTAEGVGGGAVL